MMNSESTKHIFGLLGEEVDYSRSPEIFESIFALDGAPGSFEIINCPTEKLGEQLQRLQTDGFHALCVTIPHKEAIAPYLDETDRIAGALRSVNSVKFTESGICGLNTDSYGFAQPLLPFARELKGKTALILGAGGAARSVAYSLALDCEMSEIVFCSRGAERLSKTKSMLQEIFPRLIVKTVGWTEERALDAHDDVAIIVNASPLGGPNAPLQSVDGLFGNLPPGAMFYDLNYNGDGMLKAEAAKQCRRVFDGFPMLIHQALRSYYLWTGHNFSFEAVYARITENA